MAVKCNIAANVTKKVKTSQWGFIKDKDLDRAIIENYLESLECIGFSLKSCNDFSDECDSINNQNNKDFTCNMNVTGMSFIIDIDPITPEEIKFYLAVGDIYGAKQPLTYKWIFDEDKFEIIGEDDEPIVKFKAKVGHDVDLMVTPISLEVTDANGCKDTKQCFYTPTGMKCNNNYEPCYPASQLTVQYIFVTCSQGKSLIVTPN